MGPPVLFSHGEAFCKLEFWNGMTPLSVAAFFGDQALVRCLLQAGSDVTVSNSRGDLPEDLATAQHHHQVTAAGKFFHDRKRWVQRRSAFVQTYSLLFEMQEESRPEYQQRISMYIRSAACLI